MRQFTPCAWASCLLLILVSTTPVQAWFGTNAAATSNRKPTRPPPPSNIKILILPGFFNDSSDYVLSQAPQGSLVQSLRKRGWDVDNDQVRIVPMARTDWLQVFWRGALDLQFWQGVAPPTGPAFRWYLERVKDNIQEMTINDDDNDPKVVLLCHSAGGWLARAVLGYYSQQNDDSRLLEKVCGVVTLGAPHSPPPPTVMDMTRGALKKTDQSFPGAYHSEDGLFYVTVIGDAVQGVKQERKNPLEPTSTTGFAFNSYEAVCGDGTVFGDGVVPCVAAHLEGATQLDLEGIFHSINVPDKWYGSDAVMDLWYEEMMRLIVQKQRGAIGGVLPKNPLDGIFTR